MQAGHEELLGGFHGLTNNCRCFWLSATLKVPQKKVSLRCDEHPVCSVKDL